MSIIVNLFLMAYLLVMVILTILTVFWATLLIFKPEQATKKELIRQSPVRTRFGFTE
ncbi:MAG: hypothetical protein WBO73_16695 [Gammaproteobacteria bacterium]